RGQSFSEAMAEVHRAIETVAATEDDAALRREGVDVVHGRGVFRSPISLDVDGTSIRSQRFIIATGAGPAVPPIDGLRDADPLTNENLFDLAQQPRRLAVLGGGAIGAEMSQAFARLGTDVTLIEAEDRILTKEEPEASQVITEAFEEAGIRVRTGGMVNKVEMAQGESRVHVDGGEPVDVDRVLVAIGRKPSTSNMGLEDIGVELDERRFVRTDDTMATSVPGIWAVGDVAGSLQLTHAANRMAYVAVGNALSRWSKVRKQRFRADQVPWATFTTPEIGRVGMTEADAVDHGGRVAYLPMTEVDRAVSTGETRGYIKLVAGPRPLLRGAGGGRLLGATAVAAVGGELVHEVALAMRTNMFTGRLAQTVHTYPTWSMAVQQAAAQFFFEVGGREARPARR
ncbi:MAG: FAD-dependent oxidoreductase, partial [Acidimicrobiales bacterium]